MLVPASLFQMVLSWTSKNIGADKLAEGREVKSVIRNGIVVN